MFYSLLKLVFIKGFTVYGTVGYLFKDEVELDFSIGKINELNNVFLHIYEHEEIKPWEVKANILKKERTENIYSLDLFFTIDDIKELYNKYSEKKKQFIKLKYDPIQNENEEYIYFTKILKLTYVGNKYFQFERSITENLHQFLVCELRNLANIFLFREDFTKVFVDGKKYAIDKKFLEEFFNIYKKNISIKEIGAVCHVFAQKFIDNQKKKLRNRSFFEIYEYFLEFKREIFESIDYQYTNNLLEMDLIKNKKSKLKKGILIRACETIIIGDSNTKIKCFTEKGEEMIFEKHKVYKDLIFIPLNELTDKHIIYFVVCHKPLEGKWKISNRIFINKNN